jgi:hypothetical protein
VRYSEPRPIDTFENTVHIDDSEFLAASQPAKDDIRIEYHDKSEIPPKHLSFDEYSFNNSQEKESGRNIQPNAEPWRPFTSRLDFEVAELILETHLNKNQTNSLLSLIRRCINDPMSFSLTNSKDLTAIWEAARAKTTTVSYYAMSVHIIFTDRLFSSIRRFSVFHIPRKHLKRKWNMMYGLGHCGTGATSLHRTLTLSRNFDGTRNAFSSTIKQKINIKGLSPSLGLPTAGGNYR